MNFNTGIVIFNKGAFGGAPKRYTNFFQYLVNKYPGKFYFFVDSNLYEQLKQIFPSLPYSHIKIIGNQQLNKIEAQPDSRNPSFIKGIIPDPLEIDKKNSILRKVYWYYKNRFKQKALFNELEKYRREYNIKVFHGVFSGILPLVFYLQQPRKAAILFSDMDSWFSDVHSEMKKLWYRKYYSFNFALENSDMVDFLSPYILDGVKDRNVKIKTGSAAVAPCSFTDYSKCAAGNKNKIEIAFCSRLEPDKNPLLYLEAVNIIHKKYPDIRFHLLGEGTLVNEINEYIKVNNLASCINFQFHKNPPEIFSRALIFVSLQTNTNYPSQSVLEAMACGNAIIASNRGDTELFINSKNGVMVELNARDISYAMEKMIKNSDETKAMGRYAREFVMKNHTIEKSSDYYLDLYNKIYSKVFKG